MSQLDTRRIDASPIIAADPHRRYAGRQDMPDILANISVRVVAATVAELADYITREDDRWAAALARAESKVLKILQVNTPERRS